MKRILIILLGFMVLTSCGGVDTASSEVEKNISECGGFEERAVFNFKAYSEEMSCDQLVIWKYNKTEKVLNIVNQDVRLNCCGEHDIKIEKTEENIKYTMIDNPDHGARCDCMCYYDYSADIGNVSGTEINLSVFTDVAENEGTENVWEGKIDLSEGSGIIVVKERSGEMCR